MGEHFVQAHRDKKEDIQMIKKWMYERVYEAELFENKQFASRRHATCDGQRPAVASRLWFKLIR